jgi:tripartite-type tricarboxylate transporter receptor subunit TctC
MKTCFRAFQVLAMACCFVSGIAHAQAQPSAPSWPTKPVRMIVPYPGGASVDVLARAIGAELAKKWGQPVVIDPKPGANTVIGADAAAHARDGHTLLFTTDATITINPYVYAKLPYDPVKDLLPVSMLVSFGQFLVANGKFPANSLQEVIALAKEKPGTYSYSSYGAGSQPHLAMEMFKKRASVDIVHVPHKGLPPALNAVVAGEVAFSLMAASSSRTHLVAGTIKPIAYAGKKRLAEYPNVPTFAELGYPEVDANVWVGVFAPAGTSDAQIEQINRDIQAVLHDAEFNAAQVAGRGYDIAALGPREFARYIADELVSRAELVRVSGAKLD